MHVKCEATEFSKKVFFKILWSARQKYIVKRPLFLIRYNMRADTLRYYTDFSRFGPKFQDILAVAMLLPYFAMLFVGLKKL